MAVRSFEERMAHRERVKREAMAAGFSALRPPRGKAAYRRRQGDGTEEWLDLEGNECAPPEPPAPVGPSIEDMAIETVRMMNEGEQVRVVIGPKIDTETLTRVLAQTTPHVALTEYTVADIKAYLRARGVTVGNEKRDELVQLVQTLHTEREQR